jgi:hypothetical protein
LKVITGAAVLAHLQQAARPFRDSHDGEAGYPVQVFAAFRVEFAAVERAPVCFGRPQKAVLQIELVAQAF